MDAVAVLRSCLASLVLLGLAVPAGAGATIFTVIPADESQMPTDVLRMDQALFSITTGDLNGGDVCVVAEDIPDPGDGSLDCASNPGPAWGTKNRVASAAGTHWNLLEAPYLQPGDWRLLADGGGTDVLSEPFTVIRCNPGECDSRLALEVVNRWKAAAGAMAGPLLATCTTFQLMPGGDLDPMSVTGSWRDALKKPSLKNVKDAWTKVSAVWSWEAPAVDGFSFSAWSKPAEAWESLQSGFRDVALSLARSVSCRAAAMYDDIVNDPPDPAYGGVLPPQQTPIADTGNALVDSLAEAVNEQAATGAAALVAYERYQGADLAGSASGVHRQTAAISAFARRAADSMRESAALLRRYAGTLALDPEFDTETLSAAYLDRIDAAARQVAATGFRVADLQRFAAAGLTDEEIEEVRQNMLATDTSKAATGTTLWTLLVNAAAAMERQAEPMAAFGRAALAVSGSTNRPPVATFSLPGGAPRRDSPAAFDASESYDPDEPLATHAWDFGDGTRATGPQPSHVYTSEGTFDVVLTVTDGDGVSASTTRSVTVKPPLPAATVRPTVSSETAEGEFISSTDGTWSGDPTLVTRRWRRCDAVGQACVDIIDWDQSAVSRRLVPEDAGKRLRLRVTASNVHGSSVVDSAPSSVIVARPPISTSPPGISGETFVGGLLGLVNNFWSGTAPLEFAYQWRRCDATGSGCAPIAGATESNYVPVTADVGRTIRVAITAGNVAGSDTEVTDATSVIVASDPPGNLTPPRIVGEPKVEQQLTVDPGTWDTGETLTYQYTWRRCAPGGGSCADIWSGGSTYTASPDDVGRTLLVRVRASSSTGVTTLSTAVTPTIADRLAVNLSPPADACCSPAPVEGDILSSDDGAWDMTPATRLSHQWMSCNAAGDDCEAIPGQDTVRMGVEAAEVGTTIRHQVTATNSAGSVTARSKPTGVVSGAPNPYETAPGWEATDVVLGIPDSTSGRGPMGIAFDPRNPQTLYYVNFGPFYGHDGWLHRTTMPGPRGSAFRQRIIDQPIGGANMGLAFGKDGRLYEATRSAGVWELDPHDRVNPRKRLVSSVANAGGTTIDPISGDLFVSTLGNPTHGSDIWRVRDPWSAEPTAERYGSDRAVTADVDGIQFDADGRYLYGEDGGMIFRISGTASPKPVREEIVNLPGADGVAVTYGETPTVFVNRTNGRLTKVDMSRQPYEVIDIVSNATRGDFVAVGPDGCLYATMSRSIMRVTAAGGSCGELNLQPTSIDVTPPVTTATRRTPANAAGWDRRAVGIDLASADEPRGSGLKHLRYTLAGAEVGSETDVDGAADVTVAGEGVTTVSYWGVDEAGNKELAEQQVVRIDRLAPARTISVPATGQQVELGQALAADFSCEDTGSGVAACIGTVTDGAPLNTATEGEHTLTLTASDHAGNSTTLTRRYTVVDTLAPTTTAVRSAEPNGDGWNDGSVRVHLQASDGGTGVRSLEWSKSGAETGGQTVVGSVAEVPVSADGVTILRYRATDVAGNREDERELTVRVDKTTPTVDISVPAEGQQVAVGTELTLTYACADAASGVKSCVGDLPNSTRLDTAATGQRTLAVTAADAAGNRVTATRTWSVVGRQPPASPAADTRAPAIAIAVPADGASLLVGEMLRPVFACADEPGGSGVATCAATAGVTVGGVLETAAKGGHVLEVAAADRAGNRASAQRDYRVVSPDALISIPPARKCVSRRKFPIRLRAPRGETLVSATVLVNAKPVKVIRGARLTSTVDLQGLPKGRFEVQIRALTKSGRTLESTRRYRTCAPKKKKGKR